MREDSCAGYTYCGPIGGCVFVDTTWHQPSKQPYVSRNRRLPSAALPSFPSLPGPIDSLMLSGFP